MITVLFPYDNLLNFTELKGYQHYLSPGIVISPPKVNKSFPLSFLPDNTFKMPLTILIALFGHAFLLMSAALTSPNNVTPALQRADSAQFGGTLANTSQREIDFLYHSISLTGFFSVYNPV